MKRYRAILERALVRAMPAEGPAALVDAVRYATDSGGKRLRPIVCLAAAEAAGGRARDAAHAACAIELLHGYTLVHDDLPAMDGDEMRRGKPSVWRAFGEANAILAGDALQALAFGEAAKTARNGAAVTAALARAAYGVVAGQVEDLALAELKARGSRPSRSAVERTYERKTADLFAAAAEMGALAAGGSAACVRKLSAYGRALGFAFQLEDDLLDGDSPYGERTTRALIAERTRRATDALARLPGPTAFLADLAVRLAGRTK